MTEFSRNILAKALGDYILTYLDEKIGLSDVLIEGRCAQLVGQIINVLNDQELDDFACLEEIIRLLQAVGLETDRHDF